MTFTESSKYGKGFQVNSKTTTPNYANVWYKYWTFQNEFVNYGSYRFRELDKLDWIRLGISRFNDNLYGEFPEEMMLWLFEEWDRLWESGSKACKGEALSEAMQELREEYLKIVD